MTDTLTPLILDFLEWIGQQPRLYAEVMEIWRTSCARLTVWEDAIDQDLVILRCAPNWKLRVELSLQQKSKTPGAGKNSCGRSVEPVGAY